MTHIVYCDDERPFREAFQEHNAPDIQITPTGDIYALPQFLNNMKSLPDLVVIDLYHTKPTLDRHQEQEVNDAVERKLRELNKVTEELRVIVNRGKWPAGLEALMQIRKFSKLEDLPVLLYTRQGLSLLDDTQLGKAYSLHAEWMLKGRSSEFERGRMLLFIEQQRLRSKRLKRDVVLTFVGVGLGLLATVIYEAIVALIAA